MAIGVSAVLPIYFGSHASMPKSVRKMLRERQGKKADETEEEEDDLEDIDRITKEEAYLFPIFGSITLLGLFLAFKYLDKRIINLILSSYFAILGTAGLARMGVYIFRNCISKERYSALEKWRFELSKGKEEYILVHFNNLHITFTVLSIFLSAYHLYTNNWIASDFIALAFSFNAISFLKLDTFFTGIVLLSGLFFYDIYWVFYSSKTFGQSVMVAVATSFEAPIKIVYPKDGFMTMKDFTMLGLGDIVIPGVFVSLALRFDYARALEKPVELLKSAPKDASIKVPQPGDSYSRPYFHAVLASYIAGLVTTIVVMHQFKAAQPALLYLSPACILSVVFTALFRGELQAFWNWTDEDEDSKAKETDKEQSKKATESSSDGHGVDVATSTSMVLPETEGLRQRQL
ncbi:hypothetical protein P389DRAFT_183385 [Cystobasidium minutum MCA 4210]|uniref:uncharacterized protein n=1 Tax=Cystobasidium minutum MCA 4210 TaxID=1397322 RepID=UPI0034CF71B8|eukprot:jgi/Rhomi1/183385/fgenesh1_pm.3_\